MAIPSDILHAPSQLVAGTTAPLSPLTGTDAVKDATAPEVTVTEPEDGIVVELSTVTVRGTCTDYHLETFTINGEAVPLGTGGAFEKAVFLASGSWGTYIEATAEDAYRNVTTVTRYVEVAPLEVQIASPADGAVLDATSVNVTGTVKGPRDAEVFVNGQRAARDGESFTLASLALSEGPNTLTAHAQTPGDSAEHVIAVTRDTIAPAVTIEVPDSIDIFDATSVDVSGRVDDPTVQSVTVNGVQAHLYGGYFVAVGVALNADGPCAIVAEATDAAGHTGQGSVTVTRDTLPPELAITSPEDDETVHETPIPVSGTVWDATLYDVKVNGLTAVVAGGTFTVAEVPLPHDGPNVVLAVARDCVGRHTERLIIVNLEGPPTVAVLDVVFSPRSTAEHAKVKVIGTVHNATSICGRNETHPVVPGSGANQVSGTIQGTNFEIDGIVVQAGVNVLSVTASNGVGQTKVEVVVDLDAESEAYGNPDDTAYAILSVIVEGQAGEGGEKLAGGGMFTTFGGLAEKGNQPGISVPDKGDETNVFVGTRMRFSVEAGSCSAEFVSATISLGSTLTIVSNGNASPHAKRSATVTKGDYSENGIMYTFGGFWWDAVATEAGSWTPTADATLMDSGNPIAPLLTVETNKVRGNNDAVKSVSFEVPGSPDTGWLLEGSSGTNQVLVSKGAPGSIGVKATVTMAIGLLTDQVSWFRNGEFAGQGHELAWDLMTPDQAYDVIAFGDANGNQKPDPQDGESASTIKVDAGYANVVGGDPPRNHFSCYVGESVIASLVLEDFTETAPMPQVQGWYLLPEIAPEGYCALDIFEVEGGHNHDNSTSVTLNGISPGTVTVLVAIQPPGMLLYPPAACVFLAGMATDAERGDEKPSLYAGYSYTKTDEGPGHIRDVADIAEKKLGYSVTKERKVTRAMFLKALANHVVWYWVGDGPEKQEPERFDYFYVVPPAGKKVDWLTPDDIGGEKLKDAGVKYKLVFLCCCYSARAGWASFSKAFNNEEGSYVVLVAESLFRRNSCENPIDKK